MKLVAASSSCLAVCRLFTEAWIETPLGRQLLHVAAVASSRRRGLKPYVVPHISQCGVSPLHGGVD